MTNDQARPRTELDAMSMATMLLNGATWRQHGTEDAWVMTAIYKDGRVTMTRERDGFSQKFEPRAITQLFSRRV